MKLGGFVGESIKGLGERFNLVGVLPTLLLFLFILALFAGGAPSNPPDICALVKQADQLQLNDAVFLIIGVVAFSLILMPLQMRFLKILEGYWGSSWFARKMSSLGTWLQGRTLDRLRKQVKTDSDEIDKMTGEQKKQMKHAAWRLHHHFPAEDRLLPTKLGNILRAGEDNAGKFYSLDVVTIWPRLYPLLPGTVTAILDDRRNQLDMAVRFCFTFWAMALVSLFILKDHGLWLLVPVAALLLSWLSYRSALEAGMAYGESIKAAVDLHRFDLLKALRMPLPEDIESEREINKRLSRFLRQGVKMTDKYVHPGGQTESAAKP